MDEEQIESIGDSGVTVKRGRKKAISAEELAGVAVKVEEAKEEKLIRPKECNSCNYKYKSNYCISCINYKEK